MDVTQTPLGLSSLCSSVWVLSSGFLPVGFCVLLLLLLLLLLLAAVFLLLLLLFLFAHFTELLVGAAYIGSHAMILRPGLAYGCRAVYVLGSAGPWVPPSRLPPGRLLDWCSAACLLLHWAAGPLADPRLALVICPGFLVALPLCGFCALGRAPHPELLGPRRRRRSSK